VLEPPRHRQTALPISTCSVLTLVDGMTMAGRRRSDPALDVSSSSGTTSAGSGVRSPEVMVWTGEVTWREVAGLREQLFDQMDTCRDGVSLDVRRVTVIDRTGLALLIGANHRAHSMGRPLSLVDDAGPVTSALTMAHVIADFSVIRLPDPARSTSDPSPPPIGRVAVVEPTSPTEPGLGQWATALDRYLDALWQGERSTATAVALALFHQGVAPERIINDLLAQAQTVVGDLWHEGRWSTAGEHLATAITESVLHELSSTASHASGVPVLGSRGQTAVVCGEGEWHTLPSLMAATVLRLRGVHVTHVAPSLPSEDLVEYLLHDGPTVVAVTCSTSMNLVGAWRSISALRAGGMTIVCAGRGFGTDGRWGWALGADQWAPDLIRGADRVLTAIDSRPHPPRAPLAEAGIGEELLVLRRGHDQLLLDAIRAAAESAPALTLTDTASTATREMIEGILRIVAGAAIVSDPAVATEHVAWLEAGLRARSLPVEWAAVGFAAVLDVLPRDLVHTRAMTLSGRAACGRPPEPSLHPAHDWAPPDLRRP